MRLLTVLLLMVVTFTGCQTVHTYQVGREATPEAERAIKAHRKFIEGIGSQSALTVVSFHDAILAPDEEFMQRSEIDMPTDLKDVKSHLQLARNDWKDIVVETGQRVKDKMSSYNTTASEDKIKRLLEDGQREVDAAEKALKRYKGE